MILNSLIIDAIKKKSGLCFDKAKDYNILCDKIFSSTNRTIGVNTIKRLMGYILDDRKTNEYTLNTIAMYMGFQCWNDMYGAFRLDSEWNYSDDTVYVQDLHLGSTIKIKYLNRTIIFQVIIFKGIQALKVIEATNSSLKADDILFVEHLRKGEILESKVVYRGDKIGNYRTNGKILEIETIKV